MARFADELASRDTRVTFKCQSRVDLLLRDGEIDAFRRAGAHTVWVGAESGSQKVLDAMDKGTRIEQIYEATERLHSAGIQVGFFLQFGYPGEDREDIDMTRRMVRECRPDEIGMSVSYPLPGTKFHQMVQKDLGLKQNWVDSEDLDMMFVGTYSTAVLPRVVPSAPQGVPRAPVGATAARRVAHAGAPRRRIFSTGSGRPLPRSHSAARPLPDASLDAGLGTGRRVVAAVHDATAGGRADSGKPRMSRRPKIVLYNPRSVFYTMPLALVAVGSSIDRCEFDVRIIDGRLEADPVAAVLDEIEGALVLGISVLTGDPIRDALEVSRAAKAQRPELTVVWGGWHPSLFPTETLSESSVDIAVRGQGEASFAEIVERLAGGKDLDGALRDRIPPRRGGGR